MSFVDRKGLISTPTKIGDHYEYCWSSDYARNIGWFLGGYYRLLIMINRGDHCWVYISHHYWDPLSVIFFQPSAMANRMNRGYLTSHDSAACYGKSWLHGMVHDFGSARSWPAPSNRFVIEVHYFGGNFFPFCQGDFLPKVRATRLFMWVVSACEKKIRKCKPTETKTSYDCYFFQLLALVVSDEPMNSEDVCNAGRHSPKRFRLVLYHGQH